MAKKVIDFPIGLPFHTTPAKSRFMKEFKVILDKLSVPYFDICCASGTSGGSTLRITSGGDFQSVSSSTPTAVGINSGTTNLTLSKALVEKRTAVAANITQVLTAAPLSNGLITSTSAATVSLTLPTATLLATQLGAARGTTFEFIVDNSLGANIVTVVVGAGITVPGTIVITGSATLTVAVGEVGVFKLVFVSTTAAKLFRTS